MRSRARSILVLLALAPVPVGAAGRDQGLPVTLSADPVSQQLRCTDPGGALVGEVPWVLRSDLMGPATYLVVEREAGGVAECAAEIRFRVLAEEKIEYRVAVKSDLAGSVSWRVEYGEKNDIRLTPCIPRPSQDDRACLWGGVPRPLLARLQGAIEARLKGDEELVPVEVVRFDSSPPACLDR